MGHDIAACADVLRCGWVDLSKPDVVAYHDTEWGVPVHDDHTLFEFLVLESAQAGLSWVTILRKREAYRQAFDGFDASMIARYDADKVAELLLNAGIVRNRLKVLATISNAQCFLSVQAEFGSFAAYVWRFVGGVPKVNTWHSQAECPATTTESDAMSKDMRRRGFKFMGSTVCYAYMQAVGMVNDHIVGCFRREDILRIT
ncbi:MAG: DNA-3-methyladenine glycosylase I [Halothiobacillaceae bacterium]